MFVGSRSFKAASLRYGKDQNLHKDFPTLTIFEMMEMHSVGAPILSHSEHS
jgi:hypothetical protein